MSEITPVRQRGALLAINKAVATSAGLIGPYIMGSQIQQSASNAADGYASGFFVCGVVATVCGLVGTLFLRPERDLASFTAQTACEKSAALSYV